MRKYNALPVVFKPVRTVSIGEYDDQWSPDFGKYVLTCLEPTCNKVFFSDRPHTKYHSCACKQRAYRRRKNGNG